MIFFSIFLCCSRFFRRSGRTYRRQGSLPDRYANSTGGSPMSGTGESSVAGYSDAYSSSGSAGKLSIAHFLVSGFASFLIVKVTVHDMWIFVDVKIHDVEVHVILWIARQKARRRLTSSRSVGAVHPQGVAAAENAQFTPQVVAHWVVRQYRKRFPKAFADRRILWTHGFPGREYNAHFGLFQTPHVWLVFSPRGVHEDHEEKEPTKTIPTNWEPKNSSIRLYQGTKASAI